MKKVKIGQIYKTGDILFEITYIDKNLSELHYLYEIINGGVLNNSGQCFGEIWFQDNLEKNKIILVK